MFAFMLRIDNASVIIHRQFWSARKTTGPNPAFLYRIMALHELNIYE